jgi:beta-phosphoglucomutase-like phosphatase (HAD superfamily)
VAILDVDGTLVDTNYQHALELRAGLDETPLRGSGQLGWGEPDRLARLQQKDRSLQGDRIQLPALVLSE